MPNKNESARAHPLSRSADMPTGRLLNHLNFWNFKYYFNPLCKVDTGLVFYNFLPLWTSIEKNQNSIVIDKVHIQ